MATGVKNKLKRIIGTDGTDEQKIIDLFNLLKAQGANWVACCRKDWVLAVNCFEKLWFVYDGFCL